MDKVNRQEALQSDHNDVDVSQLQRNISLTPEQRLSEHQNALDLIFDLEQAGQKLREISHEKSQ